MCDRMGKNLYKCAACVCLNVCVCVCVKENILNGTNSLKIHPHTVHLISLKMQNKKKNVKKIQKTIKQQVIHTNQVLWWGGTAIQNSNKCTSRLLQNSVSIATSTLFTMVTLPCQRWTLVGHGLP